MREAREMKQIETEMDKWSKYVERNIWREQVAKDGQRNEEEEMEPGIEVETDNGAVSCCEDREMQEQDWVLIKRANACKPTGLDRSQNQEESMNSDVLS